MQEHTEETKVENKSIKDKIQSFYDNLTKEALAYKDAMMRCGCDC